MDDVRSLRNQIREIARQQATEPVNPNLATQTEFVVRTVTLKTYPTVASAWYGFELLDISGPETEGSAPTYSAKPCPRGLMLNLGTNVPPVGTVVRMGAGPDGRLAFRY